MMYKLDVNKAESKSEIYRPSVCEQAGLFSSGAQRKTQTSLPSALRKGGYGR